jgi:hypothetical protein
MSLSKPECCSASLGVIEQSLGVIEQSLGVIEQSLDADSASSEPCLGEPCLGNDAAGAIPSLKDREIQLWHSGNSDERIPAGHAVPANDVPLAPHSRATPAPNHRKLPL